MIERGEKRNLWEKKCGYRNWLFFSFSFPSFNSRVSKVNCAREREKCLQSVCCRSYSSVWVFFTLTRMQCLMIRNRAPLYFSCHFHSDWLGLYRSFSVPPEKPQIFDDRGQEVRLKLGPYKVGDNVVLKCVATGGKKKKGFTVKVAWFLFNIRSINIFEFTWKILPVETLMHFKMLCMTFISCSIFFTSDSNSFSRNQYRFQHFFFYLNPITHWTSIQ